MNYNDLRAMISSEKKAHPLRDSTSSFHIETSETRPYIEPQFEKVIFERERPTIVLISAVGATGKTALATRLSRDLQLPLLDLSKHKPVGDNTLTGILTRAYELTNVSAVLSALSNGEYGLLIDGIDEGRSKTTQKAFEAFLDDVAQLCGRGTPTTIVMLGRTQVLDSCWEYLTDSGVETALLTILPFGAAEAKSYIDTFVSESPTSAMYLSARDTILDRLGQTFVRGLDRKEDSFLRFIGYPPVLDAIVTLLSEERNYHKLLQKLDEAEGGAFEISLLNRIGHYILDREREAKVLPNILQPMLENAPIDLRNRAEERLFLPDEQAAGLVAHCLEAEVKCEGLGEPVIDDDYEKRLADWLPEHPFLDGRNFRNAVFEALALARLIASAREAYVGLANDYLQSHKSSYHLIYMLNLNSIGGQVPVKALRWIVAAALEFRSVHSSVELRIASDEAEENDDASRAIEVEIGVMLGAKRTLAQAFEFRADFSVDSELDLGARLANALVAVQCGVVLGGAQEIELGAPVEIVGRTIALRARALTLRPARESGDGPTEVVVEAGSLDSTIETIVPNGVPLEFLIGDPKGIAYPIVNFVVKTEKPPPDPLFVQKYMRLKRILMEFRSHSKGSLARYRHKIENIRVLKNAIGESVLRRLVADGVLRLEGNFYYLDSDQLAELVGVTYLDLRKGRIPGTLHRYIETISA